jgi:hypothetical protein
MRLDLHPGAERSGRAASAALPLPAQPRMNETISHAPRAPLCDFCRSALARGERNRLVWDSGVAGELVLAELCAGCATRFFGSRRSQVDILRLVQDRRASALAGRASALAPKAVGFAARGVLYLLIAVAFFLIVTTISSSAH